MISVALLLHAGLGLAVDSEITSSSDCREWRSFIQAGAEVNNYSRIQTSNAVLVADPTQRHAAKPAEGNTNQIAAATFQSYM